MTTDPKSPVRRQRLSIEDREAKAQAEIARLQGMKRKALESTVEQAVDALSAIRDTKVEIPADMREGAEKLAMKLAMWLAKPGAAS